MHDKLKKSGKITAIVLAAGRSQRMGDENKLLIQIDGRPMVEQLVRTLSDSSVDEILMVLGYQADKIKRALAGYNVIFVANPDYEQGLSSSLIAGLQKTDKSDEAILICLADMPLLRKDTVEALIEAFDPDAGREICLPVYQGERGNPVLWSSRFVAEMQCLQGDMGAKGLLYKYTNQVFEVPTLDASILQDFDTPKAIEDYYQNGQDK